MKSQKLICPHCGADLEKEGGVINVQSGYHTYNVRIKNKVAMDYESEEFEADGNVNDFVCGRCEEDIRDYLESQGVML
jgi:hypothetical protein